MNRIATYASSLPLFIIATSGPVAGHLLATLGMSTALELVLILACSASMVLFGVLAGILTVTAAAHHNANSRGDQNSHAHPAVLLVLAVVSAALAVLCLWWIPGQSHPQTYVLLCLCLTAHALGESEYRFALQSRSMTRPLSLLLGMSASPDMWDGKDHFGLSSLCVGGTDWVLLALPSLIYGSATLLTPSDTSPPRRNPRVLWSSCGMIVAALLAAVSFEIWITCESWYDGGVRDSNGRIRLLFSPGSNKYPFVFWMLLSAWISFRALKVSAVSGLRSFSRDAEYGVVGINALLLLSASTWFWKLRVPGSILGALFISLVGVGAFVPNLKAARGPSGR